MYQEIKKLADEAIAVQNKYKMDAALRSISGISEDAMNGIKSAIVPLTADEIAQQAVVYGVKAGAGLTAKDFARAETITDPEFLKIVADDAKRIQAKKKGKK